MVFHNGMQNADTDILPVVGIYRWNFKRTITQMKERQVDNSNAASRRNTYPGNHAKPST